MSTVLIQGRSTTNLDPLLGNRGKVEEINVTNGAAHVSLNGVVTSASGTLFAQPITQIAKTTMAVDGSDGVEFWYQGTGCKEFWIYSAQGFASMKMWVGFSTNNADYNTVATRLNAMRTLDSTPTGARVQDCFPLLDTTKIGDKFLHVVWDGTNLIKTIGLTNNNNAATGLYLMTRE